MASPTPDDLRRFRAEVDALWERLTRLEEQLAGMEPAVEGAETPFRPWTPREEVASPPAAGEVLFAELVDLPAAGSPREETPAAAFPGPIPPRRKAPPPPRPTPAPAPTPSKADDSRDWERLVGEQGLTWVGAFILVLAIGFGVHWAWTTLATPPWLRVTAFHLLGVTFLVGAYWLRDRAAQLFSRALAGLGLFTLYTAGYAALHLYDIWPQEIKYHVAFAEGVAITSLAIWIALRADAIEILLIGALGGYLTPVLTSSGSGNHVALFSYLALLNVALLTCATWRGWNILKPLVLAATALMFALWHGSSQFGPEKTWSTQWFLALHAAILLASTTLPPVLWRRPSEWFDQVTLTGSSLWFMGQTWLLFHEREGQQLALVSWGLSALHLGLFAATWRQVTHADRMPRLHLGLFALFFTLAAPLQIDNPHYWAATWCVQGFIFAAIGIYFADRQMYASAMLVLVLAVGRLLGFDLPALLFLSRAGDPADRRQLFVLFLVVSAWLAGTGAWYYLWRRVRPQWTASHEFLQLVQPCSAILLGGANVLFMAGLLLHFSLRTTIVLWVVDVGLLWLVGFGRNLFAVRLYAAMLALFAVGLGTLTEIQFNDESPPHWESSRLGLLLLVTGLYFVAGWSYRRLSLAAAAGDERFDKTVLQQESQLEFVFSLLANFLVLGIVTWSIHDAYYLASDNNVNATVNLRMLEQATYSAAWAIHAAILVAVGFALRVPMWRQLGLVGLGLVVGKVMLLDLSHLELFPRVLAFSVLGVLLLAVSFLYQRRRRSPAGTPPD